MATVPLRECRVHASRERPNRGGPGIRVVDPVNQFLRDAHVEVLQQQFRQHVTDPSIRLSKHRPERSPADPVAAPSSPSTTPPAGSRGFTFFIPAVEIDPVLK